MSFDAPVTAGYAAYELRGFVAHRSDSGASRREEWRGGGAAGVAEGHKKGNARRRRVVELL